MGDGEVVVAVSEGHEYVGGTRGSGIVFSAVDVLGMRGVGGVCDMGLARSGVVGECIRGLGLGFASPVGTGGVLDVCLGCGGVVGIG